MLRRLILLLAFLAAGAVHADDSGYPWRETGYIPVAVGTPQQTLLMYQAMFPNPSVWGTGPYPAVVDYSGYEPATTIFDGLDDRFLAAGYAVVGVNMRGTHGSGGTFDYFEPQQGKDGADAIEWLAKRPWSNGRLGMAGKSWPGISQLYVAAQRPPSLKAVVPGHIFADLYRDVAYPGGVMNVTFDSYWSLSRIYEGYLTGPIYYSETDDEQALINQLGHLPNILLNPFVRALSYQFDDPFYHGRSTWYFADQVRVPVFLVQTWQDEQVGARAVHVVERLKGNTKWRLAATNGDHGEYYGPDIFPHILRFMSYYLKQEIPAGEQRTVTVPLLLPNGKPHPWRTATRPETYGEALARYEAENPVVINWENGATGERRAAWSQTYANWPPPNQAVWRLYPHPDGTLRSTTYTASGLNLLGLVSPKAYGAVDYVYSPLVGTQERGGYGIEAPFIDTEVVPPADWADRPPHGTSAEFTSMPLSEDKVLLGSASVDLYVSSTAVDTDFEVTVSEVRADGYEVFVQQGWLRASHRMEDTALSTPLRPYHTHRLTDAALLAAGQPTKVRIEVFPFGHVFRQGSRIRIAVTAPHTHPDLWGFACLPLPATNTIYTSAQYPSSVALPLLSGDRARAPYPPVNSLRNQPFRVAAETDNARGALDTLLAQTNSLFTEDTWSDSMETLFALGEAIRIPDAGSITAVSQDALSAWFQQWSAGVGLAAPTSPADPAAVPTDAWQDWQQAVAATSYDPAQPDQYFVDWFENWYADWTSAPTIP